MIRITTTHRLRPLAGIGALAAATLLTLPGHVGAAQSIGYIPAVSLNYALRDLSTEKGTRALYSRIARAAEEVCPPYVEGSLAVSSEQALVKSCRQQAIDRAIQQIGNRRLAAVRRHMAHVG